MVLAYDIPARNCLYEGHMFGVKSDLPESNDMLGVKR